jgi:hypothetical protein
MMQQTQTAKLKKPNPLTPFPAREGGTRDSGSPLLRGEGLGERSIRAIAYITNMTENP